jgi:hypothetical protein
MATCFDNLIAIKSLCSGVSGSSGLFIEDIGITADEAGQYINSEYQNGKLFIEDKIRFSTDIVRKTISNHFAGHITTKSLIDSQLLGHYQDSLQLKAGSAATLGGISLTLTNSNSYYNVFVNAISLQVNVTQDIDVLVYDLISGSLLDTITVSAVANEIVTKTVNKTYSSPKRKLDLIFVYDTEGISSNTTLLSTTGCTSCNGYRYSNNYISSNAIYLEDSDTKIRSSLTTTTHTFGLSVNYSIQCSIENWLCEVANQMALPILYYTGMEIMRYALYYSNRQNSSVNIDAETNQKRLDFYTQAYNEALEATIKKINLPKYDPCFKCNEVVRHAVILP